MTVISFGVYANETQESNLEYSNTLITNQTSSAFTMVVMDCYSGYTSCGKPFTACGETQSEIAMNIIRAECFYAISIVTLL